MTDKTLSQDLICGFIWCVALGITFMFCWILFDIISHGIPEISWTFLTSSVQQAGRSGGIGPIIISTLLILLVCLCVSIPLALATAILLSEFSNSHQRFTRLISTSLEILAGIPSIVFGLFGNAFFCIICGLGFSILSGGLTLACMVLPILTRSIEIGLRSVSDDYRLAGAALAIPRVKLLWRIILPAATPGLVAGLMLGIGRALAETAALIFTSGYVDRMPGSLLDSGRALSIHIYDLAMNVSGGETNAYATALILLVLLLVINLVAQWLSHRFLYRKVQL